MIGARVTRIAWRVINLGSIFENIPGRGDPTVFCRRWPPLPSPLWHRTTFETIPDYSNMPPGAPRISLDSVCTEIDRLMYVTDELRFSNPIMRFLFFDSKWRVYRFCLTRVRKPDFCDRWSSLYNTFWWAESRGMVSFFSYAPKYTDYRRRKLVP